MYICIHIRIYRHIQTYTLLYRHPQIAVWWCFRGKAADDPGPLGGLSPARSAVMDHGTGLSCADSGLETSVRNHGDALGALDAGLGGGCEKSGLQNGCRWREKVGAQLPRKIEYYMFLLRNLCFIFNCFVYSLHNSCNTQKIQFSAF